MTQNRFRSIVAGAVALFDFFLVLATVFGWLQKWGMTEDTYKQVTGAVIALLVNLAGIYNNPKDPANY